MLTFHHSKADLLREAKYQRAHLRASARDIAVALSHSDDARLANLAQWAGTHALSFRAAQFALVKLRQGGKVHARMFLNAAGRITGESMRHCAYSNGPHWVVYGHLIRASRKVTEGGAE